MLDSRIGGKGDLVQRRDEFRHEDLRQEQRLGIEAKRVRFESTAGDEDVGLTLHQPEQLAEQHRRTESDNLAAAFEVETRPDEQPCDDRQPDRARPEQRDRRIDEGPHAVACQRASQRRARARQRGKQIDQRLPPEIERAAHDHFGQGDKRGGEEHQRLHAKQVGDHRLAIIGGGDGCAKELDRGEQSVEQQQQPERLANSEWVDRIRLD